MDRDTINREIKIFSEKCFDAIDKAYFNKKKTRIQLKFDETRYLDFGFISSDHDECCEDDDEYEGSIISLYFGLNEEGDLEEIASFNTDVLPLYVIKNAIYSILYDILS